MERFRVVSIVTAVALVLVTVVPPASGGPMKKLMNRGLRYIEEPTGQPPALGLSVADENLEVSLEYLILPDGPGAWVKGAKWDEFVIKVSNISSEIALIQSVQLLDPRGVFIPAGTDPWDVESESEQMMSDYKDIGISVAIFAAPGAIAGVAIASGSIGAMAGAAAVTAVAAPVAAVAAPLYFLKRRGKKRADKENIEDEFTHREQSRPLMLAGGGGTFASRFFPIVPNPRALMVSYSVGGKPGMLQIPLDVLTGLHVEGDEVAEAHPATSDGGQ